MFLIVLASGSGERMGGDIPKCFLTIDGKAILNRTLERLSLFPFISNLIVTVPAVGYENWKNTILTWGYSKVKKIISGGDTRVQSMMYAMDAISRLLISDEWIGIHDGARPFVRQNVLFLCLQKAKEIGAAVLAVRAKDTIKMVGKDGLITKTLDRDICWNIQTPQIVHLSILLKVYQYYISRQDSWRYFSDDASMVESLGFPVGIVESDYDNIKITTQEDLLFAKHVLYPNG